MNHEGKVIQLRKINSGLHKIAMRLHSGNIPEPHSRENAKMMMQLARWQKAVVAMSKNAQSQISLAEVRVQNLKNRRGSQKFAARQSAGNQIQNANDLLDAAEEASKTIASILRRLGRNAQMELAKELADQGYKAMKKALEGKTHELTHIVQQGPSISSFVKTPNVMVGGTGALLVLAAGVTLIAMLLTRGSKD